MRGCVVLRRAPLAPAPCPIRLRGCAAAMRVPAGVAPPFSLRERRVCATASRRPVPVFNSVVGGWFVLGHQANSSLNPTTTRTRPRPNPVSITMGDDAPVCDEFVAQVFRKQFCQTCFQHKDAHDSKAAGSSSSGGGSSGSASEATPPAPSGMCLLCCGQSIPPPPPARCRRRWLPGSRSASRQCKLIALFLSRPAPQAMAARLQREREEQEAREAEARRLEEARAETARLGKLWCSLLAAAVVVFVVVVELMLMSIE